MTSVSLKVVERYRTVLADRARGDRSNARRLTQPINKPKGIDRTVLKENATTDTSLEEAVPTNRRDIQPKDVFTTTPDKVGVLSLAQTGKDLSRALDTQVSKDKGHTAVSNLSQYLIETQGGGGAKPAGRR